MGINGLMHCTSCNNLIRKAVTINGLCPVCRENIKLKEEIEMLNRQLKVEKDANIVHIENILKLKEHYITEEEWKVELEENFNNNFNTITENISWLSEGATGALRAHYLYAFQKISTQYSNIFLTGIVGSELLRPVHNIGDIYHPNIKPLLLADNIEEALEKLLSNSNPPEFFNSDFLGDYKNHIRESIHNTLIEPYKDLTQGERFLCFNITEVLRKYFGTELIVENNIGVVRPPFMDYEFIDFIIDRLKDKYKKKYPGAKTNLPFGQARAWELVGALMREGLL